MYDVIGLNTVICCECGKQYSTIVPTNDAGSYWGFCPACTTQLEAEYKAATEPINDDSVEDAFVDMLIEASNKLGDDLLTAFGVVWMFVEGIEIFVPQLEDGVTECYMTIDPAKAEW